MLRVGLVAIAPQELVPGAVFHILQEFGLAGLLIQQAAAAHEGQVALLIHGFPGVHGGTVTVQVLDKGMVVIQRFFGGVQAAFFAGQAVEVNQRRGKPAARKAAPIQHFAFLGGVSIAESAVCALQIHDGMQHLLGCIHPFGRAGFAVLVQIIHRFGQVVDGAAHCIGTVAVFDQAVPGPPAVHLAARGIGGHQVVQQAGIFVIRIGNAVKQLFAAHGRGQRRFGIRAKGIAAEHQRIGQHAATRPADLRHQPPGAHLGLPGWAAAAVGILPRRRVKVLVGKGVQHTLHGLAQGIAGDGAVLVAGVFLPDDLMQLGSWAAVQVDPAAGLRLAGHAAGGRRRGGAVFEGGGVVGVPQADAERIRQSGKHTVADDPGLAFAVGFHRSGGHSAVPAEGGERHGGAVRTEFPQRRTERHLVVVLRQQWKFAGFGFRGVVIAVNIAGDHMEIIALPRHSQPHAQLGGVGRIHLQGVAQRITSGGELRTVMRTVQRPVKAGLCAGSFRHRHPGILDPAGKADV